MAELRIKKEEMTTKAENDLRDRTKRFALQIVHMFPSLPKTVEAQVFTPLE